MTIARRVAAVVVVLASTAAAQELGPFDNGFPLSEEVRLGRETERIVRRALPMVSDRGVRSYVTALGTRLAQYIPPAHQHTGFRYSFHVIDVSDILSFALPGGPVLISRGMLEAIPSEPLVAALIAHQIAHVALRQGGRQATRGERFEVVDVADQMLGTIPREPGEGTPAADGGIGLSPYILRYDAHMDLEARSVAAAMIVRAGYGANASAEAFTALAAAGGGAWLADHPGSDAPAGDASTMPAADPFTAVRARLLGMPRPRSAAASIRARAIAAAPLGPLGVDVPSGDSRPAWVGTLLQVEVPANWRRRVSPMAVLFAPLGAGFERGDGAVAFSHVLQVGVALRSGQSLEHDMAALLRRLGETNPRLTWTPAYQRTRLGGLPALATAASNVSAETGRFEYISVAGALMDDRRLLYVIGIAPQIEAGTYRAAFNRVRASLRLVSR